MESSTVTPTAFTRAVEELRSVTPRPEIKLEELPAPQRIAPYSYALSGLVLQDEEEVATGRLILLHDPAGHEAWDGLTRLVTYVTAELEPDLATDPLLPAVGWSWLVDALYEQGATYTAIGGTVTQTISTRFGQLAEESPAADVEIRASWTPLDEYLAPHVRAWCDLLASTAGLPPPGVTALTDRYLGI